MNTAANVHQQAFLNHQMKHGVVSTKAGGGVKEEIKLFSEKDGMHDELRRCEAINKSRNRILFCVFFEYEF